MKIVDCFMFFNEFELLEVRLNSLSPYVDRFVLCESTSTHSGREKPLYFDENKAKFEKFPITHLVCDGKMVSADHGKHARVSEYWRKENYQREFLLSGLKDENPDTIVLISDVDEVPDLRTYDWKEGVFKQRMYYYYFNVFTGNARWKGSIAAKKGNIDTLTKLRDMRDRLPSVGKGWHFSTLGKTDDIIQKIESFAHQELNTPDKKRKIEENREKLVDPYNRHDRKFTVEMPSGPQWLLDNRERYKELFYES